MSAVGPPPPPPPPPAPPAPPSAAPADKRPSHQHKPHPRPQHGSQHKDGKRHDAGKGHKPPSKGEGRSKEAPKPAPATADKASENRLRRETPFLATIRFKNDLPEVPGDPKMLVTQMQPDKLASFGLTTLEREPKRQLLLPFDLGIPISLLDMERYQVPEGKQELHPADQALLGDDSEGRILLGNPLAGPRAKARMTKNTEVSWLMRTTYIANDSDAVRKSGVGEKKAKSLRQAGATEDTGVPDRQAQIEAIEATFEAARLPPVHQTKRDLVPVEVLPVLPDFECWANKYITAQFETDPTEDVEVLQKLPAHLRKKVAARSMLKGIKVDQAVPHRSSGQQAQPEGQRLMALVVPASVPEARDEAAGPSNPSELQGDYHWSREYAYTLIKCEDEIAEGRQEFFLTFKDGVAAYCDINARVTLTRRDATDPKLRGRSGMARGDEEASAASQFIRPSKVTLRMRGQTEDEERERSAKLRRLLEG